MIKKIEERIIKNTDSIIFCLEKIGKNQDHIETIMNEALNLQNGYKSMLKMIQDLALEIKKLKK